MEAYLPRRYSMDKFYLDNDCIVITPIERKLNQELS